jgi:histidine ammonia-lyase
MQEDHVSMGWAATVKLRRVLDNLVSLLAVELLAGARGLALRAPLVPSRSGEIAIRMLGSKPGPDEFLAPVVEAARDLLAGPALRAEIEAALGPLS